MQKLSIKLTTLLLMTAAAAPTLAMAQSGGNGATYDVITVTARKKSETLLQVPESISVISSAAIEDAGIRGIEDLSKYTPNVNFNNGFSPAFSTLNARGITTPQGAEPPMALVIDGVQLSDLTFLNVDLLNIERIEVLRGPQGSLYGRNAIAGAINITTKTPTNEFSGLAKFSYANGDDYVAQANLSGPIMEDQLYFTIGGSFRDFGGTYYNDPANRVTVFPDPMFNGYFPPLGERRKANGIEDKSVRGGLIFNDGGPLYVALRGSYTDSEFGIFANELVLDETEINDEDSHLATNLDLTQTRELWEGSLKVDYDFGGVVLSSITYRNSARQTAYGDGDFSTLPALIQDTRIDIDAWSQEIRLSSDETSGYSWLIGGYYQDRESLRTLALPFELAPTMLLQDSADKNISEAWAVFGQASVDLGSDFEVTVGLRYDHDDRSSEDTGLTAPPNNYVEQSFHALQPKFSLKYNWDDNFQSYITVARGFRSGGFNAATSSQRLYEQETNWSYELGFKGSLLDQRLFLSGAVFYIELDNEQLYFVTTSPPAQNLTNIDKTSKTGIELEAIARPVDGLDITLGLGTADGVIEEFAAEPSSVDNKTPQANGYTMSGSIQYRIPLTPDITLRPYASFERRGSIYWSADNTFVTPPKNLVDLRLFIESEHWSIGGFVKNLTNTRYPTRVGPNSANYAPLGGPILTLRGMNTPRSYGVEANLRF